MSKLKKVVIFLVVLGVLIIINLPKEDERIKMEKEFIIDDMTFTGTIFYENKELVNFRPSPENRYECNVEFNLTTKEFRDTGQLVLLSDNQPIVIEQLDLVKRFEDEDITLITLYLGYYENGVKNKEKVIMNLQSFVYFKKEHNYFPFNEFYNDLISILNKKGYMQYDYDKIEEIILENREKWDLVIEELKNK